MTREWRKQQICKADNREEAIKFVESQYKPFRKNAMKVVDKYHKDYGRTN